LAFVKLSSCKILGKNSISTEYFSYVFISKGPSVRWAPVATPVLFVLICSLVLIGNKEIDFVAIQV
jgi:hypothetical protein